MVVARRLTPSERQFWRLSFVSVMYALLNFLAVILPVMYWYLKNVLAWTLDILVGIYRDKQC